MKSITNVIFEVNNETKADALCAEDQQNQPLSGFAPRNLWTNKTKRAVANVLLVTPLTQILSVLRPSRWECNSTPARNASTSYSPPHNMARCTVTLINSAPL
ncbi:hypothetical protein GWI33_010361 [Rhynchophorus ferrugineus]|uniref:Uncharacterized protein n=1 Tax=Rhynchophorus ferrugineus TaxID=354439 RepID=A0A834IE53_RHYFE|nr:hypothetical protein GWI33_010361 [Rhynchophorus ferrugineus]